MECSSIEGDTGVARELGGVEPHKQSSKKNQTCTLQDKVALCVQSADL